MIPYTTAAYTLFHRGTQALSRVESNGIRIDTPYLDGVIKSTEVKIKTLQKEMESSNVMKVWKKRYGHRSNSGSTDQLAKVLFEDLGYEPVALTEKGKPKTDEASLNAIDDPFVKMYLEIKKLQKAQGTYLKGIRREVVDGMLHPSFSLNTTTTFRSSSQSPNFQNIPIRNEEIGKLVRTAFVPRKGNHLVEIDYAGIEVRIAACYHKDPTMLDYIHDPSKDMHRDMAMECFLLEQEQVTKKVRYCGKNMFVFPQFYGDWYIDCARSLWEAIHTMHLETADGVDLKKHLKSQGIKELGDMNPKLKARKGTFERHIQLVEKDFWERRFHVYSAWKKRWVTKYQQRGWMLTKTGFICQGWMKRNMIINYPIQGAAFHCLLWALTRLVLVDLVRQKMKTLIVGQIHDSILADVPADELDDFLGLANEVMTKLVARHWPWINVPLEVEAEVTPIDGSWNLKKERKIA